MKHVMIILASLTLCLSSCSGNAQVVPFSQLPTAAQTFVQTYFAEADIAVVLVDKDGLYDEYTVTMNNRIQMEFDHNGSLEEIKTGQLPVPQGIVPAAIDQYVATHFPNAFIVEYSVNRRTQKVELNNRLDLEFDLKGNFIRIDD